LYGLTSQIRRAAVSVVLNIVEGDRRRLRKEFLRFLDLSGASLAELEACLEIALDLTFISKKDFSLVDEKRRELAVMLHAFAIAVRKQK
jgi:four helix bundle protein